jgi:hypothetical protein
MTWNQFNSKDSYVIILYIRYALDMFYILTLHCFVDLWNVKLNE